MGENHPGLYPQPRRAGPGRPTRFVPALKERIIALIAERGWNAGAIAAECGVDSTGLYRAIRDDKKFATRVNDAKMQFLATLEKEARRRAVEGFTERRYSPKGDAYDVRHYSDALLTKLMKAHGPELYGDRMTVQKTVTVKAEIGVRRLSLDGQKRLRELLLSEQVPQDAEFRLLEDSGGEARHGVDQPAHQEDANQDHDDPTDGVEQEDLQDPEDHLAEEPVRTGDSHVPHLQPHEEDIQEEEESLGDDGSAEEDQHGSDGSHATSYPASGSEVGGGFTDSEDTDTLDLDEDPDAL